MNSPGKIPLRERINLRIIVFVVAIGAIVGFPVYLFVDSVVTGGVKDRGDYKEVDLKAMSDFPFDQTRGTLEDVPERWRRLDGERILVTGEIWVRNSTSSQLNNFEVVYSISSCCFSGPPQIQHFVEANVLNGSVPYYRGLVKVLGTLRVDVQRDETGRVSRVYRMEVEHVEPA